MVIAAQNARIRELLQEVNSNVEADRRMKFLTIETESSLGTLWDKKVCDQLCSKEELQRAAKKEQMRPIPCKEEKEGQQVAKKTVSKQILAAKTRLNWIGQSRQTIFSH